MSTTDETIARREMQHGHFSHMAQTAQALKRTLELASASGHERKAPIELQWEALEMICTKLARIVCGDAGHADHWHDIAGYARLVEIELGGAKP